MIETLDNLRSKINEFRAEISKLEAEIKIIQDKCPHTEYYLMYYSWRIGCMEPKRFCKACDALLSESPTEKEVEDFLAEEDARSRKYWEEQYPDIPYPTFGAYYEEKIVDSE